MSMKFVTTLSIHVFLFILFSTSANCDIFRVQIIPDTGIDRCFVDKWNHGESCPELGQIYYGQDGNYQGVNAKFQDNGDGTITDVHTQLMWQKNTADANGDGEVDNEFIGHDVLAWAAAKNYCEQLDFAGYRDWRLPNLKELSSLIDFSNLDNFQPLYAEFDFYLFGEYWTSNQSSIEGRACTVSTYYREFNCDTVDIYPSYTRCVRGESTHYGSFVDNGDDTVTDLTTNLTWQKKAADIDGNKVLSDNDVTTWPDALYYCERLELGGKTDWRLPTITELTSIFDTSMSNTPYINMLFSPHDTIENYYWSSSPKVNVTGSVFRINFSNGFSQAPGVRYLTGAMVRCVTDGDGRSSEDYLKDAMLTLQVLSGNQPIIPPAAKRDVNFDNVLGIGEVLFKLQQNLNSSTQ